MKFGWIVYSHAAPGYLVRNGSNAFTVLEKNRAEVHLTYPDWAQTAHRQIIPVAIQEKVELFEMAHHMVRKGECLSIICQDAGVNKGDVVRMNNIKDPDLIFPGQHLILPPRGFRLC